MKYDFVIVGGGSAGCTLASRLTEDPNTSVLLLEAGPDYTNFEQVPDDVKLGNNVWRSAYGNHSWGYLATATPRQTDPIIIPRGKTTGGSSSINGQVLFRGIPQDYDNWAEWGNTEWAFTNVLPYFKKLENDLDFPGGDFHGNDGPIPVRRYKREEWLPYFGAFYDACVSVGYPAHPDHNDPETNGVAARPMNNIDGVRMSTALTYLSMARHRMNLTIKGDVLAHRILFDGNKAIGVEAESGGEVFKIDADQVIISSGAIAAPQIMLLSGIGPKTHLDEFGIAQILDLPGVGENLRDHPAAFVLYRGDSEQPDIDAPNIQIGLRISPEGSTTEADLQISPILMSSEHAPSSVVIESDDFHFGISFALQNALGKGRLRLASADPAQQPIINYNYLSDPFDRQQMRHGLRMALEIADESPFKEYIIERINPTESDLVSDSSIDDWLLRNVYTQHHSSGTCKMGDSSDPMAVVDQYSHVHGIENLRIVDASIMPDVIRANTNATTIMIAERVADWIKQGI